MTDNTNPFLEKYGKNIDKTRTPIDLSESHEPVQKKVTGRISINLHILIACWTFAWVAFTIAVPLIRANGVSFLFLMLRKAKYDLLLIWGPIYVFGIWTAGCTLLYLFCALISKNTYDNATELEQ